MTIKAGDKCIGDHTGVIFTILFSSEQYVIIENDEPYMIGDVKIHPKGRQHCIPVDEFIRWFNPYTPPREYWTYTFKTRFKKILNSPKVFPTKKEAEDHYRSCYWASLNEWYTVYEISNICEGDEKKETLDG